MDNLPITPRSRSAANRAGDSANDHMSGGRTEAKGKERIVDSPNINCRYQFLYPAIRSCETISVDVLHISLYPSF